MGGGPDKRQTTAADTLSSQAKGDQATSDTGKAVTQPFYTTEATEGTPYYQDQVDATSGATARAFAPARAALQRRVGAQVGLPSGFKEGAVADLDEAQAGAFDDQAMNAQREKFAARNQGAAGLNPLGWSAKASGDNQSVMNANLRKPGMAGLLGGVAGGLASAIPF